MKVLVFSDIHGDLRALEQIVTRQADIYISAGDLSNFGKGLDRCGEILKPLGQRVWVLPGNHETRSENQSFCEHYGFLDFHRLVRPLESASGITRWAGLGYSNVTPFDTPGEYSEEEIGQALAKLDGLESLHLVVHFPPLNTRLDEFAPGKHAGSLTLREWVTRAQPAYLFCGHIHETAGRSDRIGQTHCFNVGKQGYTLDV
jgi:uncharacterized protein